MRADLAGLLGQFGKVPSARAGLGQLEAIRLALTEGRGDDRPLTEQLLKVAGSFVGEGEQVPTLPEMSALIGVTSLAGTETAGTRAEQVMRAVHGGLLKHRESTGQDVSQSDYLKGLGITEKDTLEESLDKLIPDLKRAQGAGRDVETYLGERGFINVEERRPLKQIYMNYYVFKQRIARARGGEEALPEAEQLARYAEMGERVAAENLAFMRSPAGQLQQGESGVEAAQVRRGLLPGRQDLLAFTKRAEQYATLRGDDESMGSMIRDQIGELPFGVGGMIKNMGLAGKEARIRDVAYDQLNEQMKQMGNYDKFYYDHPWTASRHEWSREAISAIQAAGGDPFARLEELIKEQTEVLRQAASKGDRPQNNVAPAAMPAPRKPAQLDSRPGR